ncbi:MAG: radical SAM protein [Eubacterium sp.]|nr:radical SAM protein [Eubacterium sp.]
MYTIESRNILTPQNGLNIYRGRTEDSIYLTEIPGGDDLDIGVKMDAPEQLSGVLRTRRNKGIIIMGNLGDPYNSHEKQYMLTRRSLKVIENNDYGVVISTKQTAISRDMDILAGIARKTKCAVEMTIPTLDEKKLKKIEGKEVSTVKERLELITELRKAGVGVIIDAYPIIPFVNDHDIPEVVQCLTDYDILGVDLMDYRLAIKKSVREFFYSQFKERFPKEFDEFSNLYEQSGELVPENAKEILAELQAICESHEIMCSSQKLKSWKRQYINKTVGDQLTIFDII